MTTENETKPIELKPEHEVKEEVIVNPTPILSEAPSSLETTLKQSHIESKVEEVASSVAQDAAVATKGIVVNVINSGAITSLARQILLHPLFSLTLVLVMFFAAKYKIQNTILEKQLLQTQIVELNKELSDLVIEKQKLDAQIKAFTDQKKKAKAENAKLRKKLQNDSPDLLKQELLDYVTRLKGKRG